MNDTEYIKRSDVIGLVEEAIKICSTEKTTKVVCAHLRTAVMDLRSADVAPRAEWVSVEERLPDKGKVVLAYRGDFRGDMINTYIYLGSGNWEDDYGYRGSAEHEGITHWMTLPEPPDMKDGDF